jgi:hypothetical protein
MAMTNEMIKRMVIETSAIGSLTYGQITTSARPPDPVDLPQGDYKDRLIAVLVGENERHQIQNRRYLDIIDRLTKTEEAKGDPLVDQVENVIKGVMGGKVPAPKVEELHRVTGRAKQDGAVIRNINRS